MFLLHCENGDFSILMKDIFCGYRVNDIISKSQEIVTLESVKKKLYVPSNYKEPLNREFIHQGKLASIMSVSLFFLKMWVGWCFMFDTYTGFQMLKVQPGKKNWCFDYFPCLCTYVGCWQGPGACEEGGKSWRCQCHLLKGWPCTTFQGWGIGSFFSLSCLKDNHVLNNCMHSLCAVLHLVTHMLILLCRQC